jgi:hypothetical protein
MDSSARTTADEETTKVGTVKIRHNVKLHPETIARAEEVAKEVKPRRRLVSRKVKAVTIKTVKVDPRVMEAALKLANGDHSRLTIEHDGSVIVWNYPRTTKPQDNR